MNILLIGGGGLLGNGIVRTLFKNGQHIIVFSGHTPDEPVGDNVYYQGDVTEYGTLQGIIKRHKIDCIIHNAAVSSPLLYPDNPYKICRTNILGTLTALEAARAFDVKKFIYISSTAVYGAVDTEFVYADRSRRYADSVYGATKIACEELVRNYGMETVSLRYGYIYGPGRKVTCPIRELVLKLLCTGKAKLDYGSDQMQDYIYVDDASEALLSVLSAPTWPQREYNVGSGQMTPFSEVQDIVQEEFPNAKIEIGRGTFGFTFQSAIDITPMRLDFGWSPRVMFSEGLKQYVRWLKTVL